MDVDSPALLPCIEGRILAMRGQKVIIDADLAALYGVTTKALNQAIKRNLERFPADFMFALTPGEKAEVVTNCDHLRNLKYSRTLPFAFTEYGAIQAANVLGSAQASRWASTWCAPSYACVNWPSLTKTWPSDLLSWRRRRSRLRCSSTLSAETRAINSGRSSMLCAS
ncbi:ORF6N domain-containing protein [Variovorax sp. MHTC-1]|uniref:ORF6N domain-containing protein n=1 Tax=Variovorax sp. MHTC-1 TaxID=2495593 RepID=UPI0021AE8596|nr:ORF6N domain-containing protein [Variovorax sp. MHTC-1]